MKIKLIRETDATTRRSAGERVRLTPLHRRRSVVRGTRREAVAMPPRGKLATPELRRLLTKLSIGAQHNCPVTQLSRSSPRTVRRWQVHTVCASNKSAYLSRNEARSTDDGTRHEDDRQAEEPSERDGDQRDHCENEPLLCIRHRSQLIN